MKERGKMNRFRLAMAVCFVIALAAMPAGAQYRKAHSEVMEAKAVDYTRYQSYFEKNNSGLKGTVSYLVITNQREFDRIFGAAAVAGSEFLPEGAFKTRLVVTTIKRGNSIREYKVKQVAADKGKLFVWYDAEDRAQGDATFSSPLILAVAKGNYREVVFMENGKKAGAVRLKK
jgi:hypothetical protein